MMSGVALLRRVVDTRSPLRTRWFGEHWSRRTRLLVVVGLGAAYGLAFVALYRGLGVDIAPIASLLVAVAAGLLGLPAGVIAALAIFPMDVYLRTVVGSEAWMGHHQDPITWTVGLVVLGGALGWLRDLAAQVEVQAREIQVRRHELQLQIAERQAAEHAAERRAAELAAVFDAAADGIMIEDAAGTILHVNQAARRWLSTNLGVEPATLADFCERADPRTIEGVPMADLPAEAMRGEPVQTVALVRDQTGAERRLHISAAAIAGDGHPVGVVLVARDITKLHAAIAAGAQLDGAIKTARRVAHELNNQLAPVAGYSEILAQQVAGEPAELVRRINRASMRAAKTLAQLQTIIRFEESEFGGQVMLDLDAATTDRPS